LFVFLLWLLLVVFLKSRLSPEARNARTFFPSVETVSNAHEGVDGRAGQRRGQEHKSAVAQSEQLAYEISGEHVCEDGRKGGNRLQHIDQASFQELDNHVFSLFFAIAEPKFSLIF
jgi:hypothetical protein